MRTVLTYLVIALGTPVVGGAVLLAALFGVADRAGGVYDWAPRAWGRMILWAAGVRLHLHNAECLSEARPRVYAANHLSWFDVFVLTAIVPRCKFIAKAELARIPIFGAASRAAGMIFIDRENRKAAFSSYEGAVARVQAGVSVVVCPEGTRGTSYELRPFKKGPFVLAIAAAVPVVPTVLYGTREVLPKGRWRVKSGDVHVHFLPELASVGMTYEDRDRLSVETMRPMAELLATTYGVRVSRQTRSAKPLVGV